jgi:hypothetical protein
LLLAGEAGLVVALDERFRSTEFARETRKFLDWRWKMREWEARQLFEVHGARMQNPEFRSQNFGIRNREGGRPVLDGDRSR